MARLSRGRANALERAVLLDRIRNASPPPKLDTAGFGVIAEVKFSAPSAGILSEEADPVEAAVSRAQVYRNAGARAISVLTEPSRFSGEISHLEAVAQAVDVPVMRKDFLVDPLQVVEARAFGAGGVLLIVRMLDDETLQEMVHQAHDLGMFVLLEAFDATDIARAEPYSDALIGLNCRDLQTLAVQPGRFGALANVFTTSQVRVAESGLRSVEDIESIIGLGYGMALVGSALMTSESPGRLLSSMAAVGYGVS